MADEPFHVRARKAREARGLAQQQLADALHVTQQAIQQFESGKTRRPQYADELADMLNIQPPGGRRTRERAKALMRELDETEAIANRAAAKLDADAVLGRSRGGLLDRILPLARAARDLPIYASAEAGEGEMLVSFEAIDNVRRPEPLANVQRGFGMYVTGESMEPVYDPGDLILCHPHLPARRGDDVLVIKASPDQTYYALLKRYLRGDNERIVLRQFNPPRDDIEVPRAEVAGIYVVVGKYKRR